MSEMHLVFAVNSGEPRADVVFVHGIGDMWDGCWLHPEKSPEIMNLWPYWLGDDLHKESELSVRVSSLQYGASPITKTAKSVWSHFSRRTVQPSPGWNGDAFSIIETAKEVANTFRLDGIGQRPVVFVAHSLGGLVLKQMLRYLTETSHPDYDALKSNVRGMLFLATPHSGAFLPTAIDCLGNLRHLSTSLVAEMKANSPALIDLNEWFHKAFSSLNIRARVRYETQPLGPIQIVSESSAVLSIPGVDSLAVAADHLGICKFSSKSHSVYMDAKDFVKTSILEKRPNELVTNTQHKASDGLAITAGAESRGLADEIRRQYLVKNKQTVAEQLRVTFDSIETELDSSRKVVLRQKAEDLARQIREIEQELGN